jgi:EmrB/QacA subfamily drug resistance transporter
MPSLDTSIANAGLPALAQAFHASFQEVQWVVLAYLLAITALIVGVGRAGDIIGRRRTLLAGMALFTAASLLCGIAPGLWFLIAARAAQGLGAAVMMALALASVGGTVPKEKTGSAMGLLGTLSAMGTTLGPSLGGLLMEGPGWRWLFLINVPLGILNFLLTLRFLPADAPMAKADRAGFDYPGMLALAVSLAAYALAMTLGHGRFGAFNLGLLLVAALGIALFIRIEKKAASPLIRISMFRVPVLGAGLTMSALVSAVMMATLVVGPFYLFHALGLKPVHAGLFLSVGPLVAVLAGLPAGRIVDRFGAHRMTLAGLLVIGAGCSALSFLPLGSGLSGYILPIACITSGYALFQAANNTAIMTDIRSGQRGVISGMLSLSRNLGLISGAAGLGAVFAIACGTAEMASAGPDTVAAAMRATFSVGAGLIALALAIGMGSRLLASTRPRPAEAL